MLAKRCPICGGTPQVVHYEIPQPFTNPDYQYVHFKRLECTICGATVPRLVMSVNNAIAYWNEINPNTGKRYVLQRVMTEHIWEVEE